MVYWIISILMAIASIVIAFFSSIWCWIIIILSECFLGLILIAHRKTDYKYIEEISENANYLFQKHSFYFLYPYASIDSAGAAAILAFAGIGVGIVNAINVFYIGIGIALINWFIANYISQSLNPSNRFNEIEKELGNEIFNYFNSKIYPNRKKFVLPKATDSASD